MLLLGPAECSELLCSGLPAELSEGDSPCFLGTYYVPSTGKALDLPESG